MKKILCLLPFLFLLALAGTAQNKYLPFQGKLYENGQPLSGQKAFTFSINDGGVNWTETHSSVQVNAGLYSVTLGTISPLPNVLFKHQGMHQLSILVEGNPLDVVDIYAPVENDPTVPDNVKDGVSWTELSEIPSGIDLDNTNELQVLSVSGDTLFISGGNFVVLPAGDFSTLDHLQVGQYDTLNQSDAGQSQGLANYTNNTVWQSFEPNVSGDITSIELDFNNNSSTGQIFVVIRPGEGTNQQPLSQWVFNASEFPPQPFPVPQTFVLSDPFPVVENNKYTFEITKFSAGDQSITFKTDGAANLYPKGRSSIDANTDLKFEIFIDYIIAEPNFIVDQNGTVEAPSGRIKDKTGYVAFPGEIRMFAGPKGNIPEGWLLCNGAIIDRNKYVDLFSAIGTAWGDGNGDPTKFNLPDLRGAFARGVNDGSGKDPDAGARTAMYGGGNSGDKVGSFQNDETASHKHAIDHDHPVFSSTTDGVHHHVVSRLAQTFPFVGTLPVEWESSEQGDHDAGYSDTRIDSARDIGDDGGRVYASDAGSHNHDVDLPTFEGESGSLGGSETRPYNAYVNYIIKY